MENTYSTLQSLFHKAIIHNQIELCNQLLKRGCVVDLESIVACFHHNTTFMLEQFWPYWSNSPKQSSEYKNLAISALETFDINKVPLTYESNRLNNHIKFIIDKIDDDGKRREVAIEVTKYIANNCQSELYTSILLTLLNYIPITIPTAPQIKTHIEIDFFNDIFNIKRNDDQIINHNKL